jgi:formylglycine-generating enzyme required for sulfatase activity
MKRHAALVLLVVFVTAAGCQKDKDGKRRDNARGKTAAGKSAGETAASGCPAGMAAIPAGEFMMGCPEAGMGTCYDDEKPAKAVTVGAFCIDIKEVTQKQYKSAMKAAPWFFKQCGDDCPVEQVSWNEANEYCRKTGKRLPTEAEWERAARAGSDARFPWRESPVAEHAWFNESAGGTIHPVGQKKPNAYGLYDMAGNVAEWAHDCYDAVWYARMPADNPVNEAASCPLHTVRGGSWMIRKDNAAVSDRSGFNTDIKTNFIGFRCAISLKQ